MTHPTQLGNQRWHKSSTNKDIGKYLLANCWGMLLAHFFAVVFLRYFIQGLLARAYNGDIIPVVYWIGSSVIGVGCFLFGVLLLVNLIKNGKKQHISIGEYGFVHQEGNETTQILFKDIKGMQELRYIGNGEDVTVSTRMIRIVKTDGTRILFNQYNVPTHEECFRALRMAYLTYFTSDNTLGWTNQPIWLNETLRLDTAGLHVMTDDTLLYTLTNTVTSVSEYNDLANTEVHIYGKNNPFDIPEVKFTLLSDDLYNNDLLRLCIDMRNDTL